MKAAVAVVLLCALAGVSRAATASNTTVSDGITTGLSFSAGSSLFLLSKSVPSSTSQGTVIAEFYPCYGPGMDIYYTYEAGTVPTTSSTKKTTASGSSMTGISWTNTGDETMLQYVGLQTTANSSAPMSFDVIFGTTQTQLESAYLPATKSLSGSFSSHKLTLSWTLTGTSTDSYEVFYSIQQRGKLVYPPTNYWPTACSTRLWMTQFPASQITYTSTKGKAVIPNITKDKACVATVVVTKSGGYSLIYSWISVSAANPSTLPAAALLAFLAAFAALL